MLTSMSPACLLILICFPETFGPIKIPPQTSLQIMGYILAWAPEPTPATAWEIYFSDSVLWNTGSWYSIMIIFNAYDSSMTIRLY